MKQKRRVVLIILLVIVAGLSYYLVEYSFQKEIVRLSKIYNKDNSVLVENQNPQEIIKLMKEKIDSLSFVIQKQDKILPYYTSSVEVYEKVVRTINLLDQKMEVNIERNGSENSDEFKIEKFTLRGVWNFSDLFSLIHLFESSRELYKIKIKEIKQIYSPDKNGKLISKVVFNFLLEAFYTENEKFNFDSLYSSRNLRSAMYITNYFEPLIKLDIPTNDEVLFEVEGSKLLAVLPDAVYLVDKAGNTYTLSEGDEVYLGYLTKINYEKHSCEFLKNKGGTLEKITLDLNSE